MARTIDLDKAIEIIEEKQKELCPVGRYGRNYVYGSDREKWDAWDEIIDAIDALPTLTPPNDALTLEQLQEMDGEPIYSGKYKRWFLVTYFAVLNRSQLMDSTGTPFVADDCGPLYLCPPEGEADA